MIENQRTWKALFLLAILSIIAYSNTLKASWQFDDRSSITHHRNIHIKNLDIDSLWQSMHYKDVIHRPAARVSLALNYYAGGLNVTGYHAFNILVHILTAYFLFCTILLLFQTPNLRGRYQGTEYFIALLGAALWALNPVQVQAVTYIVQRMASMAALFTIVSIFLYLKTKLTTGIRKKVCFFAGCSAAFLLGVGSKENAAMLPISILLIEAVFFQNLESLRAKKKFLITGAIACSAVFVVGFVFLKFNRGDIFWFLDYGRRFFSFQERILTEPRIVFFYLTLLFYPVPTRLNLEHIPQLSTSLFDPWTTIAAILLILLLIGMAFYYVRKLPLFSFAILFFFLNHAIESTILPLELVFEHRNYLPSLFLFVPVAAGLKWLIDKYQDKSITMYYLVTGFIVLLMVGLGTATFVRNMAWKTEKMLMEDAIEKTPQSGRAHHNLAYGYYEKIGKNQKALALYKKASKLKHHSRDDYATTIHNIGGIYYRRKEFPKTAKCWKRALEAYPVHEKLRFKLSALYAKELNKPKLAEKCLQPLLIEYPNKAKGINLKGYIFLRQKEPEKALDCFKKCFQQKAGFKDIFVNTGKAHALMNNFSMAELYFKEAYRRAPRDINIVFWLMHIALSKQDQYMLARFTDLLVEKANMEDIQSELKTLKEQGIMSIPNQTKLKLHLSSNLKEQVNLAFQPEDEEQQIN